MAEDIAALVRGLGAPHPSERESAAREIFRVGVDLARPVVEEWLEDKDLATNFIVDSSSAPSATVGVAVTPEHFAEIHAAWGSPRLADVPPDQDAMEFELHCAHGTRLDILTTSRPGGTGAIARYLQMSGEGVQQVELLVRDVDRATHCLRTKHNLEPIYPQSRPGADKTRVNFLLVPITQGKKVLIELVEAAA